MKRLFRIILIIFSALLYYSTAYSSSQPTTFLGPTAKGGYANTMTNETAYSVAGEVGGKNYRAGGTFGWQIQDRHRIKVTGEYLWQKITYNFFVGDTEQWVNQGAIGAAYEYDIPEYALNPKFDLSAYYSHAPSKNLSNSTGSFINSAGVLQNFVDMRHIAGSNAGGVAPGVTIQPWLGGIVGVDMNYDNVTYNKQNSPSENAKGFGGTAHFNQALAHNIDLGLAAGIREPFNNYQANLNWTTNSSAGAWILGIGGAYTTGKNTLPNTYNVMVSVNFLADQKTHTKQRTSSDDLKKWTSNPAIYMPQVLAIPDEGLVITTPVTSCGLTAPSFLTPITDHGPFIGDDSFPVTANFGGPDLTYTINTETPFTTPGNDVTIDPTSGLISIATVPSVDSTTISVTATNCTGSVTSNTFVVSID